MTMRHANILYLDSTRSPGQTYRRQLDPLLQDPRLLWTIASLAIVLGALVLVVVRKGRPFAPGAVFRASRLSSGNHLFPTQVLISRTSVIHYTPQWFGRLEHSIHMAHVASVRIDTKIMFSDVYVETTGGASPIRCHGHRKADAVRIQQLIEQYQTEYYSGRAGPVVPDPRVR
jgi:hypothetical protein